MAEFDVNIISSYLSHSYKSSLLNLDLASVIFEVPFLSKTGDLLDYCISLSGYGFEPSTPPPISTFCAGVTVSDSRE